MSDQLRCLFSATVEEQGDSYIVAVPEQEVRLGNLQAGETYRVAVLPSRSDDTSEIKTKPQREGDVLAYVGNFNADAFASFSVGNSNNETALDPSDTRRYLFKSNPCGIEAISPAYCIRWRSCSQAASVVSSVA